MKNTICERKRIKTPVARFDIDISGPVYI